jgi:N-acetylglucosamine kinase-like BadF-type ATPase
VLAQEDGTVVGYAEAGCCSFVEIGREAASKALASLWTHAWASAGLPPRAVDGLFIGSGSILHSDDIETNCEMVVANGMASAGHVRAENDAWNGLAGALGGRPGLFLIAGTGAVCLGRNSSGQTWRAGGWGHLLNDVGSAYQMGQAAMVAATRAADGRGPHTSLTALVCKHLQLRDLKQIFRKLHHGDVSRADVAAFAPQVVGEAEAGDEVARRIFNAGVQALAEMSVAVTTRLELREPQIGLSGGLLQNSEPFRKAVLDRLRVEVPGFKLANGGVSPALGAVILAREGIAGISVDDDFTKRLRSTAASFPGLAVI